jgi:hypothetical protein
LGKDESVKEALEFNAELQQSVYSFKIAAAGKILRDVCQLTIVVIFSSI